MKMKTKSIFVLIALMAFNIQSCDKFLEEELISDVAGSTYYTTVAGLEDAVDATYSFTRWVYSNERAYTLTVFGTDTYTNGADGNNKGFNFYDNTLNQANGVMREFWDNCYKGINQANAVINRSQRLTDVDPAMLAIRLAEVRFLRALYYFNLVRQWGDVHLTLEETVGAVVEANKTPESEIYDQAIVADLEFAIANLPATQSNYGRATKGAAEHLLGLALLTRGYKTFAKADDFSKAEQYFSNVITNYSYSLVTDLGRLWNQDNQRNSEIIFAVQYSTNPILNGGEGNRGHLYFPMEYDIQPGMIRDIANGRPFKRFRPTNYLLDLWGANRDNDNRYDMTYKHVWISNNATNTPKWTQENVDAGAKNKDGSPAVVGQNKFAVGDTAIFIPGPGKEAKWTATKKLQTRYRVYTQDEFTERIFAHIVKFQDPRRPTIQWEQGSRDWFVMRLGDTYLLRAEARFKLGNLPGAAEDINVVRTRAAFPGKVADMQITAGDVTLDFILDERARELDAEQCRWYDLTRAGTLVDRVKLYNPQGAAGVAPYHVHRPIPETQIDRTLGGYEQNCGYPGGPSCN
jgi:starch-binding outer membrane protein, SusD/RagB family